MVKIPGRLAKTPEDAERSCTDICCLLIYAGVMAGLGVCIWYGLERGDINRLDSLPDYQGTQCVQKFVYFPENWPAGVEGLNLHKHVCVDACPTEAGSTVVTYLKPDPGVTAAEEKRRQRRRLGSLLDATAGTGVEETNGLLMAPTVSPTVVEEPKEVDSTPPKPEVEAPSPPAAPSKPAAPAVPARPSVAKNEAGPATAAMGAVPPMPNLNWSPNSPTVPPVNIKDIPKTAAAPLMTGAATAAAPNGTEEVTLTGYPSVPVAGVLCLPKIGEYQGKIKDVIGSDTFFSVAMQVSDLVSHYEILIISACIAICLSFIFLFIVEWFSSVLVIASFGLVVAILSWFGFVCLQAAITGSEASEYGQQLADTTSLGVSGTQGDLILGSVSIGVACIVLLCACFQCNKCMAAAAAVKDAADCLMTMPSLMLEPLVSFLLKIPFLVIGFAGLVVLISSGDYQTVDLTQPQTLIHPDNFAILLAIYWGFVFLWTMEVLHYISVFVVIYVAEVWFFKHYGEGVRGSLCSMCGPALVVKAWGAAVSKHLGSLIYAALLVSLMRPLRWVVNLILTAEEVADNPMCAAVMSVVRWLTGACLSCMHKILDLTSQIGFMQIAYQGQLTFCEAQKFALGLVFAEKGKWAATEGLATAFVALGVGGISAGTTVLIYMIVMTVERYTSETSSQYVSDARSMAVAAGVVSVFFSLSILHHFITITDTIAYCRGLVEYETKLENPQAEEKKGSCWNCFTKSPRPARETEALLVRSALKEDE